MLILIFGCLLASVFNAESPSYRVMRDRILYDGNFKYSGNISRDKIVQLTDTYIYPKLDTEDVDYNYGCSILYNDTEYVVDAEALVPTESTELFDETILTPFQGRLDKGWYSKDYLTILFSKQRDTYKVLYPKVIERFVRMNTRENGM